MSLKAHVLKVLNFPPLLGEKKQKKSNFQFNLQKQTHSSDLFSLIKSSLAIFKLHNSKSPVGLFILTLSIRIAKYN